MLECATARTKQVEDWFKALKLHDAQSLCNDPFLREKADKIIRESGEMNMEIAMRAAKVSPEDILSRYRAIEYLESKALNQEGIEPAVAKALQSHFDDLAQIVRVLAHRTQLLMEESVGNIEGGNIVEGLIAWPRLGRATPHIDGVDMQQPIDPKLAQDLLSHFNQQYPNLALKSWKDVTKKSAKLEKIGDALSF
jgi:hypothetical protein